MRIVQLVKRRQFRGAEVFARELSDALADRGHEVLFLGLMEPVHEELRPVTARCADLGVRPRGPLDPFAAARLARVISGFGPDVVQANGSDTLKYSVASRWLARGDWPIVYRNIGLASDWVQGGPRRALGRFLAARLDRVVSVSRASARDFADIYSYPTERIEVIPQSARTPPFLDPVADRAALCSVSGFAENREILVHVASFTREKNHAWLVAAFTQIRSGRPGVALVLVGDGPERPAVEALVRKAGLEESVSFVGARPDAADLAGGADLFLLSSTTEGLPGAVLEASVRQVPTVATAVGGVPEIVRDGVTGVLVSPDDLSAFVEGVEGLLGDPARRLRFGAAARDLVEREYAFESAVASYAALYDAVWTRGGGQPA